MKLGRPMAADEVAGLDLLKLRGVDPAGLDRVPAAGMEIAAGRRIGRIGHLALQDDPLRTEPHLSTVISTNRAYPKSIDNIGSFMFIARAYMPRRRCWISEKSSSAIPDDFLF